MSPRAGLLLVLALFGCRAETFGDDQHPTLLDDPPVVSPYRQLPNHPVSIRSTAFIYLPVDSFLVRIQEREALARRVSDTTFDLTLPDSLVGGQHLLEAELFGEWEEVGSLYIYGFRDTVPLRLPMGGLRNVDPVPFPWQAPTGVLLSTTEGIAYLPADGAPGVGFPHADAASGGWAVGLSYRPLHVVIRDTAPGRLTVARLDLVRGTTTVVGPAFGALSIGNSSHYELSPGWFARLQDDWSAIVPVPWTGPGADWTTGSPYGLVFGPAGDVAVPLAYQWGTPIIDVATGTFRTTVPGTNPTAAAAFGDSGRTLYLSAFRSDGFVLQRFDVATMTATATELRPYDPWHDDTSLDFAMDLGERWLFELTVKDSVWSLTLRDPETLARVATLNTPAGVACAHRAFRREAVIIPERSGGAVRVVAVGCGRVASLRFDLPYAE